MVTGHYVSHAIYVAARLGIADLLSQGPRPCDELAQASGTHAPSLRRLLRLLASAGVFAELDDGRFGLTPIGEWLQSNVPGSSRDVALLFAGPTMRSWNELLYSVQTGEAAATRALGMDPFTYFKEHPEEAAVFNRAMTAVSTQASLAVPKAYDFSPFRKMVDVGGGHGVLLAGVLKAFPRLQGVLFELPPVAEGARKQLEAAGVAERCEVVGGDFFEGVPSGADVYLLKSVIHDWDNDKSVAILKNCRRAMRPDGKVLLVEVLLPERTEPSGRDQIITGSDVNMLLIGGRERTEDEFRALYQAAGLRLSRIIPLEGTLSSVLEGVPAE
jgi:SAM-dependent methyltransferase